MKRQQKYHTKTNENNNNHYSPATLLILRFLSFFTTSLSKPGSDMSAGIGSLALPLPLRTVVCV